MEEAENESREDGQKAEGRGHFRGVARLTRPVYTCCGQAARRGDGGGGFGGRGELLVGGGVNGGSLFAHFFR